MIVKQIIKLLDIEYMHQKDTRVLLKTLEGSTLTYYGILFYILSSSAIYYSLVNSPIDYAPITARISFSIRWKSS